MASKIGHVFNPYSLDIKVPYRFLSSIDIYSSFLRWLYLTLPLAAALHLLLVPLRTRRDLFQILFSTAISTIFTIPFRLFIFWNEDSSVFHDRVPISFILEEYISLLVQAYITSTLFTLLSKGLFHPILLLKENMAKESFSIGLYSLTLFPGVGAWFIYRYEEWPHLALIILYFSILLLPIVPIIWHYFKSIPDILIWSTVACPVVFLVLADILCDHNDRGIGTKWYTYLYNALIATHFENLIFQLFSSLTTVVMIITCERSFAIIDAFHYSFPPSTSLPTFKQMLRALTFTPSPSEMLELQGMYTICQMAEKEGWVASFFIRLVPDYYLMRLYPLYAFARISDDTVDEAPTPDAAEKGFKSLVLQCQNIYSSAGSDGAGHRFSGLYLPSIETIPRFIPREIIFEILAGFGSDLVPLQRANKGFDPSKLLIQTEDDLLLYSRRVLAYPIVTFIYATWDADGLLDSKKELIQSPRVPGVEQKSQQWILDRAIDIGIAAQLVDIAKDLMHDSSKGRVYIPVSWFQTSEEKAFLAALYYGTVDSSMLAMVSKYSARLARMAEEYRQRGLPLWDYVSTDIRYPLKLFLEVYMTSRFDTWRRKGGGVERARTSTWARIWTVLKAMCN